MPKILFVSTSTTLGGAEKTLFTLATLLDQKEFEIAGIVSLKPPGFYAERLVERGLKVESLGMPRWPGWTEAKALSRIIQREKPDIVHAFMYQAIELCRLVKKISASRFTLISSPRVNYRTRSWATLLAASAMFLVVVLAMGFLISVLAKNQFAASQIALLITFLPAFLLSGFLFSIEQMPVPLQWLTRILPARYYVSVLKKIFLKGTPAPLLYADLIPLAIFAFVLALVATRSFHKRLD